MIGAILGDIIGSPHEHHATKSTDFPLFVRSSCVTDDSVLTIATAHAILDGVSYADAYRTWARRYPHAGYGGTFRQWFRQDGAGPYGSWGNGSAMRASPVGYAWNAVDDVLREAERSAAVTHDHPEGIKGAQAVALGVLLARGGMSKTDIRDELTARFKYDLGGTIDAIRPEYALDVSCQGSVPEAIICFLDTGDAEQAIRAAVSLGGDADTQASIAGALAVAFDGGASAALVGQARKRMTPDMLDVLDRFEARFPGR